MDAGTQGDRQGLASALALLGIYTTSLTSSRWRAARREKMLTLRTLRLWAIGNVERGTEPQV